MKKAIILFLIVMPVFVYGQTDTENYVKNTTYQVEVQESGEASLSDDEKIESIVYFDGLGRPKQAIAQRTGGNREDMVTPINYDSYGRQHKDYLPLPIDPQNGNYYEGIAGNTVTEELRIFYKSKFPNDFYQGNNINYIPDWDNPFNERVFEDTPRGRIIEQGSPGFDWHVTFGNDHTVKFGYGFNTNSEVPNFKVNFIGGDFSQPELLVNGTYPSNSLTKTIIKDENWQPSDGNDHTTEELKNKKGQTLLKRSFNGGIAHETHYIYDGFGNLTYVLSPEATKRILDTNGNLVVSAQNILDTYGYQYKYDLRNRLIEKKAPGKGWEYILYDKLNRPVMTQDANLRADNNKWLFNKYDVFGRVVYKGIYTPPSGENKSQIESNLLAPQYWNEERTGIATQIGDTFLYYTNQAYPSLNIEILTISYYDTYIDQGPTVLPNDVFGMPVETNAKGLPTITKTRTLDTNDWTTALIAYDYKGRVIYTDSFNEFINSRDIVRSELDFTGKILYGETQHLKGGNPNIVVRDYFTYDHLGRQLTHRQQIDNEIPQLISEDSYDELGQLVLRGIGGNSLLEGYTDLTHVNVNSDGTISNAYPGGPDLWLWPSLAKTQGVIPSDFDGGMDVTVDQNNRFIRFGLVETANGTQENSYLDYGFLVDNDSQSPTVKVIVHNTFIGTGTAYQTGDLFRVERVGSNMKFYQGNILLHTQTLTQTEEESALFGKVSFNGNLGGSISNLHIFGPLLDKKLQRVDYSYNVRGWLTDINDIEASTSFGKGLNQYSDLFNFHLDYNNVSGNTGATALYNGNIAQTLWKTENTDKNIRSYTYSYDDMNRILGATGYKGSTLNNMSSYNFHDVENIAYDQNGNLLSLNRWGTNVDHNPRGLWDELTYEYSGNRLKNVNDHSNHAFANFGFKDGNDANITTNDDYMYDNNGNMVEDRNKGITSITYNHLNLPKTVAVNNGTTNGLISYVYDATGTKLRKNVTLNGNSVVTDYVGDFIYNNESGSMKLQFFSQPEGYVEPVAGTTKSVGIAIGGTTTYTAYNYVFQYKDHLGNIRLTYADSDENGSIDANNEIIEESNYYPFGLKQSGYNNNISSHANLLAQQWKYNGIELNNDLGVDLYEMDFRNYDPAIGRFNSLDPVVHYNFSPYQAFDNNPIYWADPSGADSVQDLINDAWNQTPEDGMFHQYDSQGNHTGSYKPEPPKEGQSRPGIAYSSFLMSEYETSRKQYYHAGGIPQNPYVTSREGWYDLTSYLELYRSTIRAIGQGRASIEILNDFGFTPEMLYVMASWAVQAYEYYGGKVPRYRHWDYTIDDQTITPMGLDSPFFLGSFALANKFVGFSSAATEWTTVGRWMSEAEFNAMKSGTTVLEGAGGQTFVTTGGSGSFTAAAKGSVYVEFQVPANSLLQGGKSGWYKIIGPNSGKAQQFLLEKQGGQMLPQYRNLSNILQTKK